MAPNDLSKLRIDELDRSLARAEAKRRWIWLLVAAGAAVAVVVVLFWSGILRSATAVQAVKVSKTSVARALTMLTASGYVVAQRKAAVSSKATGRLAKLYVEEGSVVKQGDIIATLENDDLRAALDEAKAALRVADANLKNAEAELYDAEQQYNRQKALREKGAISDQAFDAAEARYKKAVASDRSARFAVERAHATIKVAEVNLEYSFIRAPFDGVILTKYADEGEVVAPFGSATNAKAAVVTMADMASLLAEVDVSESNLEKVKVGGAAEIRLDAFPNERFPGRVHTIVPTADRSKATVLTKVKFDKLDKRVLPEMSAKVAFLERPLELDEKGPFLGVPVAAIRNSPNGKSAFLIKGSEVRCVPVKVGRQWGETVEILAGLDEGDLVVLEPTDKLSDGSRIKIKE
ncbi:MAG: efflux RND transporter periplasmic adaptor subunit [Desulfomonile sp.]|nr:efflux RND transporter periplasmic adaptor subunit [Desulfomonile sp.]